MTRNLLIRGMLAGVIAAVLATLFARLFAEPQVDLAIAFEAAQAHMHHAMGAGEEVELVSRSTQKGLGLLTAVTLYGAAVGGIFSLIFAVAYGRLSRLGPRSLALLLALGAFVAIALVPALKYPPTPPAVGQHETVGFRTLVYFAMIAFSIAGMVFSIQVGRGVARRSGAFNGMLATGLLYVALIALVQTALPAVNEVPHNYPAVLLWDFRVAALGTQALLWFAIGTLFGWLAERLLLATSIQSRNS
jgi:predicted cobalt transporter CbtA